MTEHVRDGRRRDATPRGGRESPHLPPDRGFYGQTLFKFVGAAWVSVILVLFALMPIWALIDQVLKLLGLRKNVGPLGCKIKLHFDKSEVFGGIVMFSISMVLLYWLWVGYYKPNYFTKHYFGIALNEYDDKLVTSTYDGGKSLSRQIGDDGRVLIQFVPSPASDFFDVYTAHCFPHGMRPFIISTHREFDSLTDARMHYDHIAEVLEQKYGKPHEKSPSTLRYNLKGRSIGLMWHIFPKKAKFIVYYKVFNDDLIAQLPRNVEEYRRLNNEREGKVLAP